jgi:hypothetical protein
MKTLNITLLSMLSFAITYESRGDNSITIKNFTVGATNVSFSFVQPQNEYLVASTQDLRNWDLSKIFTSNQTEVMFSAPRILTPSAKEFFVVCELSTTSKVHSGNFEFSSTVTSAQNGARFTRNGGSATMQAQVSSTVGYTETFTTTASIDLNDLTIDILGSTATLHPSGLGYSFDFTINSPNELVEEASNEQVQFFSQISERFTGRYDLCKGVISLTYTEISTLTWNLSSDVSIATTISSLVSTPD